MSITSRTYDVAYELPMNIELLLHLVYGIESIFSTLAMVIRCMLQFK